MIALSLVKFAFQYYYQQDPALQSFSFQSDEYVDLMSYAESYEQIRLYSSVIVIFLVILIFKYLSHSKGVSFIWTTLFSSIGKVVSFLAIYFIFYFCLMMVVFIQFGQQLPAYQDLTSSMVSLLTITIGRFDHNPLLKYNSIVLYYIIPYLLTD